MNDYIKNSINLNYAIEAKNIIKYYGIGKTSVEYADKKLAIRDISFEVYKGECFVLLGSNGAGKTTLFKIMLSELLPTSGEI